MSAVLYNRYTCNFTLITPTIPARNKLKQSGEEKKINFIKAWLG